MGEPPAVYPLSTRRRGRGREESTPAVVQRLHWLGYVGCFAAHFSNQERLGAVTAGCLRSVRLPRSSQPVMQPPHPPPPATLAQAQGA